MFLSRRGFLAGISALSVSSRPGFAESLVNTSSPLPDPAFFEAGDFVWPKMQGAYVPYSQQAGVSVDHDREIWERERAAFLTRAEAGETDLSPEEVEALRALDYREFVARYHGDQEPGVPGVYATAAGLYVGHVGIIGMDADGTPHVIEALWEKGVTRRPYDEWIAGRPDTLVWHGRLKERPKEERAKIADEAKKFVGRPYDFWNFNLNDDTSFYCSKLVWLCVFRRLGFAVDGNANPKRAFWFSPKQLLYAPTVDRLSAPGDY